MMTSFKNYSQEFLAACDKVEGKPVREVKALDPLECAFRDPGERAAICAMLDEYRQLLEDPAIQAVLDASAKHIR